MFYLGFSGIKSIVYLTCTEMRETHHHSTAYHQTVAFQTALSVTPRILPGSSRSGAALQGRTNQEGKVAQAGTALPPQPGHSPTVWGVSGERGRAGYRQQGPPTPGCPEQNRVRSRVLPGTPVQDQQETGLQQRSEDRRGAEAGLETEQGTGMPVADLREGLGAQGGVDGHPRWGWSG